MTRQRTPLTPEQQALAEKNLGLAQHLAAAASRRSGGMMTAEEALSSAYEGLLKAAQAFDPSRADTLPDGSRDVDGAFAGYARLRINGTILDYQRTRDHVNKSQRLLYRKLVSLGHGESRTSEEVAELTGATPEEIRRVTAAVKSPPVPLPESGSSDEQHSASLEDVADAARIQRTFVDLFCELPLTSRLVVALRYYSGLPLTDIAATLGLSLSYVQAEHAEATERLYMAMLHEAR